MVICIDLGSSLARLAAPVQLCWLYAGQAVVIIEWMPSFSIGPVESGQKKTACLRRQAVHRPD
jgi:hypothetical protein